MRLENDVYVKLYGQVRHVDGLLNPHQLVAGLLVSCLNLFVAEVAMNEVRLLAAVLPRTGDFRDRGEARKPAFCPHSAWTCGPVLHPR